MEEGNPPMDSLLADFLQFSTGLIWGMGQNFSSDSTCTRQELMAVCQGYDNRSYQLLLILKLRGEKRGRGENKWNGWKESRRRRRSMSGTERKKWAMRKSWGVELEKRRAKNCQDEGWRRGVRRRNKTEEEEREENGRENRREVKPKW